MKFKLLSYNSFLGVFLRFRSQLMICNALKFHKFAFNPLSDVTLTKPYNLSFNSLCMVKKKLLFSIASERGFIGNISQPQFAKSLLTSLADGTLVELTK